MVLPFHIFSTVVRRCWFLVPIALVHGWTMVAVGQTQSDFFYSHQAASYTQPSATICDAGRHWQQTGGHGGNHERALGLYQQHCVSCHGVDGRGLADGSQGPLTLRESWAFARHLRAFSKQRATSPHAMPLASSPTVQHFSPVAAPTFMPPMQQPMVRPMNNAPHAFQSNPGLQLPLQIPASPSQPRVQSQPQMPDASPIEPEPTFEMVAPIPEPQAEMPAPKERSRPVPDDLTPEELEEELERELSRPRGEPRRMGSPDPSADSRRSTPFPVLSSPLDPIPTATPYAFSEAPGGVQTELEPPENGLPAGAKVPQPSSLPADANA